MLVTENLALTSPEEELFLITVLGTLPLYTRVKGKTNVIVYTAYYILSELNLKIQEYNFLQIAFFYSQLVWEPGAAQVTHV